MNPPESKWGIVERCLHVMTLASLTIAQPMLDLLARHAEFLVAYRFTRTDIGVLVASLLILIPLSIVALEALLTKAPDRVGRAVHGVIVAFFATLFWLQTLRNHEQLAPGVTVSIATAAGVLLAFVYQKARWIRFFVSVLSIAMVAVPATFLASPKVQKIIAMRRPSLHELPPVASSAPIFLIIFDEFPVSVLLDGDGEINRHRYPNFANLTRSASWFSNAVSAAEISEAAIPAILTGSYPKTERLPTFRDYPRNLFTLFGGAYDIWAREPMSELCPEELNVLKSQPVRDGRLSRIASDLTIIYSHLILPGPWRARLPPIDVAWRDFGGSGKRSKGGKSFFARAVEAVGLDRREEFAALTAALQQEPPALFFLHVLLPHRPWEFTPQGYRYDGGSAPGLKGGQWRDDEYLVQQSYQRLIAQVQMLDGEIGRLFHRLEETGLFDRSLIVLVGDHGASFRPGDTRRLLSKTNAHDILPVPLFVKPPGQREGRRLEHPVSTIDVLPTVLDALDIEPPWELEGRSGFDPGARTLRFITKANGTLDVDPAIHHEKYTTARWKLKLFGDGSDPLDLYRLGPDGDLVGRPTDGLVNRGPGGRTVSIKDPGRFEQVNLGDGAPFFVKGYVAGLAETESCCRLAFALNGTIYGTTRTHRNTGLRRPFSILLPPQGFREGPNRVDVYELLERDNEVRHLTLRPAQQLPAPSHQMPSKKAASRSGVVASAGSYKTAMPP